MHPRRHSLKLVALGGLGVLLATSGCAAWRVSRSARLAQLSEPYQQRPAQPSRHLLVVGDSTAVGTGASTPVHSVAGRIGAAYPHLAIENRGVDGARMADLLPQLRDSPRVDMVLIQAGGNDVIRLGDLDALHADIVRVVQRASALSAAVVLMPCGNVGNAPFFFPPVSWWMAQRSRALHRFSAGVARQHGARYVNLFHEHDDDPFVQLPAHNAADGLHPGDSGYQLWWQALRQQAALDATLGASTAPAPAAAAGRLDVSPEGRSLALRPTDADATRARCAGPRTSGP